VALALVQHGIKDASLAMFFADNSLEYFVLTLAFAYLGLPITPNKPSNGTFETAQQLKDCQATILVVSKNKLPIIQQILNDADNSQLIVRLDLIVLMDTEDESALANANIEGKVLSYAQLDSGENVLLEKIPYFQVKKPSTDPYTIVYTSGSSGLPKGAILSHRTFISSILSSLQAKCFTNYWGEIVGFACPFGHISGTYFSAVFLLTEMQIIIINSLLPSVVYKYIEEYSITLILISSLHGMDMLRNDKNNFSSLKAIITSGGKFPEHIARGLVSKFGVEMSELYGTTEFMGAVANNGPWEPGNLGSPLPNIEMKIVNIDTGKSLPAKEQGEICFRGPSCIVCYLNNEEATRAAIDSDGWYHSGDVGHYNEDGCLFLTDRLKELIKYKSWSVAPAEIETFLQTHPAIVAACVVGVKHATEGAHLRAFVQVSEGKTVTKEEIIQYVKGNRPIEAVFNHQPNWSSCSLQTIWAT